MAGLEYESNAQPDEEVREQKSAADEPERFVQQDNRQDQHVGQVEQLAGEQRDVFAQWMLDAQIVVGWKEETLEIAHKNVVQREEGVEHEGINVLEAVDGLVLLVWCEAQKAAAGKSVIFAVDVDTGVMPAVVQDAPHVGTDAADIEDVIESLVYRFAGGNRAVVGVVGDVKQKEGLGQAAQHVKAGEEPVAWRP